MSGDPELDGMPDPLVHVTVRYSMERSEYVAVDEIPEIGEERRVSGCGAIEFEIVRIVHTNRDGDDLYTITATEKV